MLISVTAATVLANVVFVFTLAAGLFLFASMLARSSQRWLIAVKAVVFTLVAALQTLTTLLVGAGLVGWLAPTLFAAAAIAYWYDLLRQ